MTPIYDPLIYDPRVYMTPYSCCIVLFIVANTHELWMHYNCSCILYCMHVYHPTTDL